MGSPPEHTDRVLIAGAGIGGLTAAIALRRAGFAVAVFERAPELAPVGAGLTLQFNALRALRTLDLDAAVVAAGVVGERAVIRHWRGRLLADLPLGPLTARYGVPSVGLHRAALHDLLLRAVGAAHVQLGRTIAGVEQHPDRITLRFADGGRESGTLLVGADGLRSVVREAIRGPEPLRYAGQTSWRGIAPPTTVPPDTPVGESWGAGRRFGLVPIREGIYWYATEDAPAGGRDDVDPRPALLTRFSRWHVPVEALISATAPARILRTDVFDRPPIETFTKGRVALLGDAAHPMTPNLGQGACQAIEDAVVLARTLAGSRDLPAALHRYDEARVARTRRVVDNAWRFGRLAQWTHPIARGVRDAGVALTPAFVQVRSIHWLYDFS